MDIHRCRFVPYPTSTINVLAFSQSKIAKGAPPGTLQNLRLAIGRANGDIEIWNPLNGAWLQESILRGGKDRSVDGLVWVQDPDEEDFSGKIIIGRLRLFSIGYTTTVTEWDLEKGQPLRESSGNHGEIWCLAAQPPVAPSSKQSNGTQPTTQSQGQNLVTGCTDGAVVLHSTAGQDLKLQRVLVRPSTKKAKVISINFKDRNLVVAGCTDSTIRIYDIRNATLIRAISMGAGPSGGPKEIIVWAVKCLPNGKIVSGDSTGEIRIWDGETYTLEQRIKSHRQDVLSLATSADGSTILSGGMDRRTVVYKQIGSGRRRWAEVSHKRYHSHDVKTMATFEGNGMSVVVSGGPDSSPMVLPLRAFDQENQRMLPTLPQRPALLSAPKKRLIMSWWDRQIHIWRIRKLSELSTDVDLDCEDEQKSGNYKLVAKIVINGEANINSVSITPNGDLLALSTFNEVKIFRLKLLPSEKWESLKVSRFEVPQKVSLGGGRNVQFSPDGRWLSIVRMDNQLVVTRVLTSQDGSTSGIRFLPSTSKLHRIDRKIEKRVLLGGLGAYNRIISRVAFSADSRILAVTDLAGYIDTWVLEGVEDLSQAINVGAPLNDASSSSSSDDSDGSDEDDQISVLGQRWRRNPSASLIPKLSAPAVVLSFRPTSKSSQNAQSNGPIVHPTRSNPHPLSHNLPHGEDRLLVVTAKKQVHEFEVLQGALSAWSRNNPTVKFPTEFKAVIDQAMDCLWDVEESRQRLWLYGSRWLWMFDLSRDLPVVPPPENDQVNSNESSAKKTIEPAKSNLKRKRGHTSGAGGKIPDRLLGTGMSRRIQHIVDNDEDAQVSEIVLNYGQNVDLSDENDEDEEDDEDGVVKDAKTRVAKLSSLDLLRHGAEAAISNHKSNGNAERDKDDESDSDEPSHWWHTYKYRPIMGIVPLSGEVINEDGGIDVALVERPEWELDLPPRYYGN